MGALTLERKALSFIEKPFCISDPDSIGNEDEAIAIVKHMRFAYYREDMNRCENNIINKNTRIIN